MSTVFQEPDIVSVWLQSQDFIGLGFNIAGSMRDGIFVSQVHNRGPAIESGKFKVGKCTRNQRRLPRKTKQTYKNFACFVKFF